MKLKDLMPGDYIGSSKKVSFWKHPIQYFFNWRVKCYSRKIYGKDCILPGMNHGRRVAFFVGGVPWYFHWTAPCAHFAPVEQWMLDPDYAIVFRREDITALGDEWANFFVEFAGDIYNLGKLFDMEFGFKRFFSFGRNLYVCSDGQRMAEEMVLHIPTLFPEVDDRKTPPCSWANHSETYSAMNIGKDARLAKIKLRFEPV